MTWRRAAHYTGKAFLIFLVVSIPGIFIQSAATWLLSNWRFNNSDWPDNPALIGMVSVANGLAGLWIYFAILFVIFKYLPAAIAEVQEGRRAASATRASLFAPSLEE